MKLQIRETNDYLFEMANVRGKTVKTPHKLKFSFAFTTKDATEGKDLVHSFRVKPVFNPEKISADKLGTMRMFGDYKYIPGPDDKDVDSRDIKEMKEFFIKYKVLFAAVWEKVLQQDVLQDYFKGNATFNVLIKEFDFYEEYKKELDKIKTVKDLYDFVKKNNLFNLYED